MKGAGSRLKVDKTGIKPLWNLHLQIFQITPEVRRKQVEVKLKVIKDYYPSLFEMYMDSPVWFVTIDPSTPLRMEDEK